jgi:hypothetical protein
MVARIVGVGRRAPRLDAGQDRRLLRHRGGGRRQGADLIMESVMIIFVGGIVGGIVGVTVISLNLRLLSIYNSIK